MATQVTRRWVVFWISLSVLCIVAMALFFGILKRESKNRVARDKAKLERVLALQKNPHLGIEWVPVHELPSGRMGYFKTTLRAGVATGRIKPPPYTFIEWDPDGPVTITFFDRYGKEIGNPMVIRPNDPSCGPNGFITFSVLAQQDTVIRLRVGGQPSPQLAKCS